MFDTHIHRRDEHHHHHRETVHEHRAPTDDSVKLLMEMEEKALDRILASVRLIGCDNWCVIHHMRDTLMDDFSFIMQYRLAGRDARTIYHRIPAYKLSPLGSHERIEQICTALVEALSKDIAAQMLAPAMQKTLSEIQTRW